MAPHRRNDALIPTLGVLFDGAAIEIAFLLSYWLRFKTGLLTFAKIGEEIPPLDAYVYGSLVVIPIWLILFESRRMYGPRRNVSGAAEAFQIVKLVSLGMLIVMSAAFFYRAFSYSRLVFGLLWVTSWFFITAGRAIMRRIEKGLYRSGRGISNAVIIGGTPGAGRILESIHNHPMLGYRLVGAFAPSKPPAESPLAAAEYLGTYADVPREIASREVELALVAIAHEDQRELYTMMGACEGINVEFLLAPDYPELAAGRMIVKEIEGISFIRVKGMPMTTWGRISKRAFDLAVSALLLALLSPLFLLIAIIIKLDSKGTVFFRQERSGLDGRPFRMIKFRSMSPLAERETGPVWASENDPRTTRVGRVLRRTSLDEFPQLINVFRGEMSLVGPRPERPYFVDRFSGREGHGAAPVPKYLDRHRMKTGMTGWAQVNGLRGNTSLEERVRYDLYYIENWSMGFDLKILLMTLGPLVLGDHARRRTSPAS
jgi:exopolysaccharide biosynthesis polyprenyl glycosylphosphotransferase